MRQRILATAASIGLLACWIAGLSWRLASPCRPSPCTPARVRTATSCLISIDTLRAGITRIVYGYARETSPNIDGFAREAVLFEQSINTGGGIAGGARIDAHLAAADRARRSGQTAAACPRPATHHAGETAPGRGLPDGCRHRRRLRVSSGLRVAAGIRSVRRAAAAAWRSSFPRSTIGWIPSEPEALSLPPHLRRPLDHLQAAPTTMAMPGTAVSPELLLRATTVAAGAAGARASSCCRSTAPSKRRSCGPPTCLQPCRGGIHGGALRRRHRLRRRAARAAFRLG